MKNKAKFIIIVLILFLNIVLYFVPNNYKKKYSVSDYKITEQYLKREKLYSFKIISGKDTFEFKIYGDYNLKKKLINSINKVNITDGYCLLLESQKIELYPLCIQNSEYKSFYLIDELKELISPDYYKKIAKDSSKFKSLNINYLNQKKYLLWNYNYFYYLSNNNKIIDLFKSDYYQIKLAAKVNNFLFIPDYDDGYTFNDAYIINMKNGKKSKWKLKYDISIDSRIIGTYKKSIFLLDEKNKVLYEIVPHKEKIRKVSGRILENGKLKKYSISDIINDNLSFVYKQYFNYEVRSGNLYLINNNSEVLLNTNINSIIYQEKNDVYYLVNDTLYYYNPYYGNVKLITNFEWKFNSENMIFIY